MNRLPGRISALEVCGSIALVDVQVGEAIYTATVVGDVVASWQVGTPVVLLFKETEVAVAKNLSGTISLRNRFKGVVTALEYGQVLSKVMFEADGHMLASIITTRSSTQLQLATGDEIEGLVKANEITVVLDAPV
ncbi:MAG TPA: TOBE domain-containing protein [Burkholderiaceae bacterium]|jgi:molybdate transport system regulatory protein|nr:TOBE domain-containing protein [Burkholderiaceae bacterium]